MITNTGVICLLDKQDLIQEILPTILKNPMILRKTSIIILIIVAIICIHRIIIIIIKEKAKIEINKHNSDTLLKTVDLLVGKGTNENDTSPPEDPVSQNNVIYISDYLLKNITGQILDNARISKEEKPPAHSSTNKKQTMSQNFLNFFNDKE